VRIPALSRNHTDPINLNGIRVLLADDCEDNRFLIRNYLKDTGVYLDEVADGEAVIRKFRSSAYHLVLLDVEMPLVDGYAAARAIRAWEREVGAERTPLLALTAHALKGEAQKSIAAGCDAHLTKPIGKGALLDAIRAYARCEAAREICLEPSQSGRPDCVRIDRSLEDIVPRYLEKRRQEVGSLRSALHTRDFDAIKSTGHKMRGTGGGYGFPTLTELGEKLETAAKARDDAAINDCITLLSNYLECLRVEFR
jgi:CheY-like chemotaxis protein/HPt (histidine-containing phosphotransfer) domain-containing protein